MPSRISKTHAPRPRSVSSEKASPVIQDAVSESTTENLQADRVLHLQRTIGNKAVGRLMKDHAVQRESHGQGCKCASCSTMQRVVDGRRKTGEHATKDVQREAHEKGCTCSSCSSMQRVVDIQRIDNQQEDLQAMRIQRGFLDDVLGFFGIITEDARKEALSALDKAKWNETIANATLMKDIAGKITAKDFVEAALVVKSPLKKQLELIVKYWSSATVSDLEPAINAASTDEKKDVWTDADLLTKLEGKLGKDPYLTFVTRIGMHQPPTTDELGEGGKEHTAPAKADEIIRDKMSAYVTEAVKKGKKIEGQIGIVAGADWDRAGVAHYGNQVWFHNTPTPKKDAINGFVDSSGRVWVERNSGNPGTVIHEGLHKYSDDAVLNTLGFNTNEGMTEYFTRQICADLGISRGNYSNNFDLITALESKVTKGVIASSYFDGKVDDLKNAFIKYRVDTKSNTQLQAGKIWDAFVDKMDSGAWAKALQCVNDDLDDTAIGNL